MRSASLTDFEITRPPAACFPDGRGILRPQLWQPRSRRSARTPAGPLLVERGGLQVVRLQALLHELWHTSPAFRELLTATADRGRDGVCGLLLYFEEIRPGNPLRPDMGRCSWAMCGQLADCPPWARACAAAALPLCVCRAAGLKPLGGPPRPQIAAAAPRPAADRPGALESSARACCGQPARPPSGRTCCGRSSRSCGRGVMTPAASTSRPSASACRSPAAATWRCGCSCGP